MSPDDEVAIPSGIDPAPVEKLDVLLHAESAYEAPAVAPRSESDNATAAGRVRVLTAT
jgi:hypothetical protein